VLTSAIALAGALVLGAASLVVALAVFEVLARLDERRVPVVLALSMAVLAVAPALAGRPFQSLRMGLLVTAGLCAAPALQGARRLLRGGLVRTDRRWERADLPAAVAIAVLIVLGAWVSWSTRLWDGALAHYGYASEIARGVLPPEHPLFPGAPLRYHVGYDVLVGLVVAFTGLAVDLACELVATLSLVLLAFALNDAGRALGGARAGALAVLVVPLGYGALSLCLAEGWGVPVGCGAWLPSGWVGAPRLPPPVISNFFQHPQGTAMPIALALLLLACERPSTARTALAALGLALLSQVQIAFFAATGLGIGVAVVADALAGGAPLRARLGHALLRAALLLAALALAFGGGVLGGGGALGEIRFGAGTFDDEPGLLVLRLLSIFGLPLLAVPVALLRLRAPPRALRLALVVMAAVCFAVPNAFSYARSWDIIKFWSVGAFFANLLLADLLAQLFVEDGSKARAMRITALVLLLASTASGALWLLRHGPFNGVIAFRYAFPPSSELGKSLLDAHGEEIAPRDRVLTSATEIWHHGFLLPGTDWRHKDAYGQLVDRAEAEARTAIARRALRRLAPEDLAALEVSWLLLGERDLKALTPAGRAALEDPQRFELRGELSVRGARWQLFRVLEAR
jgi:hypothetical protein